MIKDSISEPLLNVYLKVLCTTNSGVSDEILCIIYQFFSTSLKRRENITILQNSLEFIMNNLIIQHIIISKDDFELRNSV